MEKLQPCKINLILFLILLVQFRSLVLPSSGYTPAVSYFINCGSESSATLGLQRTFDPDFPYLVGSSGKPVKDSSTSASTPLYQTARVFHKEKSSYQFKIQRKRRHHSGPLSQTLYDIYRINVGGSILTADNDTLWRNWIKDDGFLSYPETAKDCLPFGSSLRSREEITEEIAPDFVYKTAKELKP